MSPTLNGSSEISCLECGDSIEIRKGITFISTRDCHIVFNASCNVIIHVL